MRDPGACWWRVARVLLLAAGLALLGAAFEEAPRGAARTSSEGVSSFPFSPLRSSEFFKNRKNTNKESTEAPRDLYGIEMVFATSVSAAFRDVLARAVGKWQRVLVEPGVSPRMPEGSSLCGWHGRVYDGAERIDDLEILINVTRLDGVGGVLAIGGPCGGYVVRDTFRTVTGFISIDSEDIDRYLNDLDITKLEQVVAHEIGHVLGIGSWWEQAGLVGPRVPGARYHGPYGARGYRELGGAALLPAVEDAGAVESRWTHWKEADFGNELMTPILDVGISNAPLSRLTAMSLIDLGYVVELADVDPFELPRAAARRLRGSAPPHRRSDAEGSRTSSPTWEVIHQPRTIIPVEVV